MWETLSYMPSPALIVHTHTYVGRVFKLNLMRNLPLVLFDTEFSFEEGKLVDKCYYLMLYSDDCDQRKVYRLRW